MTQERPEKARKGVWKYLNTTSLGVLFLVASFGVSIARVLSIREKLFDPSKTILRISHWQLEMGYRNAMQAVIDKYVQMRKERFGQDVEIIQIPVTERVYGQLLNTHLISGTAPDIAELGFAKLASDDQYLARYFLPLTELIDSPNPYNDPKYWLDLSEAEKAKLEKLKKLPWRETFIDGMRGGYREQLQDYFSAPTSMFTQRLFYNKQLLARAGYPEGPGSFKELLDACRKIREMKDRQGKNLIPIAGSKYSIPFFRERLQVAFTASFEPELDEGLDGSISSPESYMGFLRGVTTMRTPAIRAQYECMRLICDQFSPGFMGQDRMEAAFNFVMGRAGMIASGSWDAMSLFAQAQFDVGIMDFPLPAEGERWSEFIAGRVNEAGAGGGGLYGIFKLGKNQELAIDFLRFITSQPANQILNQKADWLPVVLGALPSERMMPFVPDPKGFSSRVNFQFGNYVQTIYGGQESRYIQGEISYDQFAKQIAKALMNKDRGGDYAWAQDYEGAWRWCRNQERVLAVQSVRELMDPGAKDAYKNYRRALLQQIRNNNGQESRYRFEQLRKKEIPDI
ncbi:MAG: extracellular solute-binding protein [Acidobacteria bacterium]|nr:extracellular solute-binding protein [Acidobacteriota bacterium]